MFRDSYVMYVRYGHYERFVYRYEYVYFTDIYVWLCNINRQSNNTRDRFIQE